MDDNVLAMFNATIPLNNFSSNILKYVDNPAELRIPKTPCFFQIKEASLVLNDIPVHECYLYFYNLADASGDTITVSTADGLQVAFTYGKGNGDHQIQVFNNRHRLQEFDVPNGALKLKVQLIPAIEQTLRTIPLWEHSTNIVSRVISDSLGMEALRTMFPDAKADDMNVVFFSTSGVNGTYRTIEQEEKEPGPGVTFVIVHPRNVSMRYGNVYPQTPEDFAFLKQLRASSWEVMGGIGK